MTFSDLSAEANAAINKMFSLQKSLAFKQFFATLILNTVTLTIAIAPVFLAFREGSISHLFLWLIYPVVIVIQQYFRQKKGRSFYIWGFVHFVTWYIINSMSSGPTWFFWVYIGLVTGNHIVFIELTLINYEIEKLSETEGWKEAKSRIQKAS